MRNKSKSSSLSTSAQGEIRNLDYSFLKQKNDGLAEELCHMKRIANNLQSDVNFILKEKFHLEQKERLLRHYAADIDSRSRNCLKKIVECSSEVTVILKLCKNMVNIENFLNASNKSNSKDEDDLGETFHQSNETNLQENENDFRENDENDSQEKAEEPHEFPARGDRRKSALLALDIEDFETEEEVPTPIQPSINQLHTIYEDSECLVSTGREEMNTQCLDNDNTTSFFNLLPNINVNNRRGDKRSNNEDVSTIVEPDSQLYDSVNDDTVPKNVEEDSGRKNSIGQCSEWEETVVNSGEDSSCNPSGFNESRPDKNDEASIGILRNLDKDGKRSTKSLRKMSFIERRSIGSPHPESSTSSIMRNSLRRKSSSSNRNSDKHGPSDDPRKKTLPRISLFKNDIESEESHTVTESLSKKKVASEEHHKKNVTNEEQEFHRKDLEHCLDKSLPFNDLSNNMLISSTPMIKLKNSMIEEQRSNGSKKSPKRKSKRKICPPSRRGTLKDENISMDLLSEMNETHERIRRKCTFYKYNPYERFEGNNTSLSPKDTSSILEDYYRSLEMKEERKLSRARRKQFSSINDRNGLKETPKSKTTVVDRSRQVFINGDKVEAHSKDHTDDDHTSSSQKTNEISKNSSKKGRNRINPVYSKLEKEDVAKSEISPLNKSGGRKRRRAVANIVYKEPSLTKKLRRE